MSMPSRPFAIWDISLRLFHWLLVIGIAAQFFTMKVGDGSYTEWHFRGGYVILGLMIYRLLWGFIGSQTAQFRNFLYRPATILQYAKGMLQRQYQLHIGHNPIGGLSAIAMLLVITMMAVSGLFISDDIFYSGPLNDKVSSDWADWLHDVHSAGETVLLALIALHIAAILYYRLWKRTNLVKPMITGSLTVDDTNPVTPPKLRPAWFGLLVLALSVGLSYVSFSYWV